MNPEVEAALNGLDPVVLAELDAAAPFLTREDRKYIVGPGDLAGVLAAVPGGTRVLETEFGRRARYESIYLDTPAFDTYLLAARRRPGRFKVRLRSYLDSGLTVAEVKTTDRRGRSVKHRRTLAGDPDIAIGLVRDFAGEFEQCAPYVAELEPSLTSRFHRSTLLLADHTGRVTIDADFRATARCGAGTGLGDLLVVETKTSGKPSPIDRLLWSAGYRPVRFSKYSTALAAIYPDLPSNRWHRVLSCLTSPTLPKSPAPTP